MLPIKKLYIDSRSKSSDSVSHTDFQIDLPTTLLMPENSGFYLTDVSIPISWFMIDNGNNKLYFKLYYPDTHETLANAWTVTIPKGDYNVATLAEAMQTHMNLIVHNGAHIPDIDQHTFSFEVTPIVELNAIQIFTNNKQVQFKILTNDELNNESNITKPLNSLNEMLQNYTISDYNTIWYSDYVNLHPIRNLYICSPNLGTFSTMSMNGDRTIIKKVPVSANYNEMIIDQNIYTGLDFIDCSRQTLSRLEFKLKDHSGNIMNLNGNYWSFSSIFGKIPEE